MSSDLKLTYPCVWVYKIIGLDSKRMRDAASSVIKSESLVISESRESRKGKYVSLNLKLTVETDEERIQWFKLLGCHPDIKLVL